MWGGVGDDLGAGHGRLSRCSFFSLSLCSFRMMVGVEWIL